MYMSSKLLKPIYILIYCYFVLFFRNDALTAAEKLLLTLRFFATGSFFITCGDFSGIHKSTACKAIQVVSEAIASLRPQYIQMPNPEQAKRQFYQIARFPKVIGAVDCTHVKIQSPGEFMRNLSEPSSKNKKKKKTKKYYVKIQSPGEFIRNLSVPSSQKEEKKNNDGFICRSSYLKLYGHL